MRPDLLNDVTVLDFSQGAAAPFAGVLLADFGAEVISVEPPGGGNQRRLVGNSFRPNLLRNKLSLVLDMKSGGAADVLRELIAEADVLIHNYRPGVPERLGYDYETARDINEELVYCSLTGYGESGPYKDRPAFDPLAQAMSGLMWNTGESDQKPSRVGASIIDLSTGVFAAFAIAMALRERDQTGTGRKIETSLLETAASFMGFWYTYFSRTNEQPQRMGHSWQGYAPVGIFETADDPIYLSVPFEHLWERFCAALGREDWVEDDLFATDEDRMANREALVEAIESEFADYTREELVELLLDAGVPVSEVQTIAEAATDDHLREREAVRPMADVDGQEVLTSVSPIRFDGSTVSVERTPPAAGADTRAVLGAVGFSDEEIETYVADGVVSTGDGD